MNPNHVIKRLKAELSELKASKAIIFGEYRKTRQQLGLMTLLFLIALIVVIVGFATR